jgi:hypothetical protein
MKFNPEAEINIMLTGTKTAFRVRIRVTLFLSMVLMLAVPSQAGPPLQLALGTEPGDVAAYVVGWMGRVEAFQEVVDSQGRPLGRKWVPVEVGLALKIQDQLKTYSDARA